MSNENNKTMEEHSICEFDFNLICEYFANVERQGPGSPEETLKALSFIDNLTSKSRIADLGCGIGGQTMVLAQNAPGQLTGLDLFPGFIDTFNRNAAQLALSHRVKGIVGSMDELPFEKESLDLIWSEGAIGNIGFTKGLNHWRDFLKKDGYIALTYESWFTDERPAEIEKFWLDAVPEMNTIGHNISVMLKAGYHLVAAFTLPETCWTDHYFEPCSKIQEAFLKQHAGNPAAEELIAEQRYEVELFRKYKEFYGYVFYIGKKK
jgi:SAM-dependent methyltransferase